MSSINIDYPQTNGPFANPATGRFNLALLGLPEDPKTAAAGPFPIPPGLQITLLVLQNGEPRFYYKLVPADITMTAPIAGNWTATKPLGVPAGVQNLVVLVALSMGTIAESDAVSKVSS